MDSTQNADHQAEIEKVRELLARNIDDFKYLVLSNTRLEEKFSSPTEPLRLDVNRISGFEIQRTENLEEWVNKKTVAKSTESLEQWVGKQKVKSKKNNTSGTIIDKIERWLMNEAKKDLFAEMDAKYGGPEGLSSQYVREIGMNLIALADKLDRLKIRTKDIS